MTLDRVFGGVVVNQPLEIQSLVEIHDQPFLIIDDDHRVVVVNKSFEERFGIARQQAVGKRCHELLGGGRLLLPCGSAAQACPFADTLHKGLSTVRRHCYRDAEGRDHVVRVQSYPIRTRDGRVFVGNLIQQDASRHHPAAAGTTCPRAQMVGESGAYRQALERLQLAAETDAPVLLLGETGTGKELAASFIHHSSRRREGPFQTLDCTVLTAELFESEVFGHVRGAFTGTVGDKPGLFELADQGTLFIDEIGELPLPLQAKLLRLLETSTFRRVGDTRTRRADVRFVCATNRELQEAAWFRSDLYYRVACITVRLPSLAERRADIPLLAGEILERISQSSGRRTTIDAAALRLLQDYDFPGNIRELRNILWVSAVNSDDGHITSGHIAMAMPPPNDQPQPVALPCTDAAAAMRGPRRRRTWDRDELEAVLRRNQGNRRAAARELGVCERTIFRKLREFGL